MPLDKNSNFCSYKKQAQWIESSSDPGPSLPAVEVSTPPPPPPPPPPPTGRHGAIATAFNGSNCSGGWRFGASWNYSTRDAARSRALSECDQSRPAGADSCSIRVSFTACGAVAYSPSTPRGSCKLTGSYGASRNAAEQAALTRCRADGSTGCRIAVPRSGDNLTVCNGSSGSAIRERAYSVDGGSSLSGMGKITDE